MADTEERIRAALDLGDSAPAAKALNAEIDRLLGLLKNTAENFNKGKISVQDFAKATGNLKDKIAENRAALDAINPEEAGAKITRAAFKIERGIGNLFSGEGIFGAIKGLATGFGGAAVAVGALADAGYLAYQKMKPVYDQWAMGLTKGGFEALTSAKERFKELQKSIETYTDATNKFVIAQKAKNDQLEREEALLKAKKEQADKGQKEAMAGIAAAHPVAPGEGEVGVEAGMKERGKRLAGGMSREQKETMESEVASYLGMKDPEMQRLKDEERKLRTRGQRAQEVGDPSQIEQARQNILANEAKQKQRQLNIQATAAQWRGQAELGTLTPRDWDALSGMTDLAIQARMREATVPPTDATGLGTPAGLTARRRRQAQMLAMHRAAASVQAAMRAAGTAAAAPGHSMGTMAALARQHQEDLAAAKTERERAAVDARYQEQLGMRAPSMTDVVVNPPSGVSRQRRTRESQARADDRTIRDLRRQVQHLEGLVGQQIQIQSHGMDLQGTTQGMIATYSAQIQALRRKLTDLQSHQNAQRRAADQTGQNAGGP